MLMIDSGVHSRIFVPDYFQSDDYKLYGRTFPNIDFHGGFVEMHDWSRVRGGTAVRARIHR